MLVALSLLEGFGSHELQGDNFLFCTFLHFKIYSRASIIKILNVNRGYLHSKIIVINIIKGGDSCVCRKQTRTPRLRCYKLRIMPHP